MDVIVPQYIISDAFNNSTITTALGLTASEVAGVIDKSAILKASNVDSEPSTSLWSASAEYAVGNKVYFLDIDGSCKGCWVQYEALQAMTTALGTKGKRPIDEPEYWVSLGAIDRYKTFDQYNGTKSFKSTGTNLTMTIQCSRITAIAFINVQAKAIKLKAYDRNSTLIFDKSGDDPAAANYKISLTQPCYDWFQYFFNDFEYVRTIAIPINLYALNLITLELTFEAYTGLECYVGNIILGRNYDIGNLQYGVSTGIIDYSKITFNETFGAHYFKQGNYRNTMNANLIIPNDKINIVRNILTQLRARPTVWQGNQHDTNYDDLIIFGIAGRFTLVHEGYNHSECNLEIEGLI